MTPTKLLAGQIIVVFGIVILGVWTATLSAYAVSPDFLSSVFENWESEFLQMAAYVVLTAILFQRGSAEQPPPEGPGPQAKSWTPSCEFKTPEFTLSIKCAVQKTS